MQGGNWLRDFVVGIVFLGGVLLVAASTLWLDRVPWREAHAVEVRFPEVENLKRGEPVLIHGFQIGEVDEINYSTDPSGGVNHVLVRLNLDHDITSQLTRETVFSIRSAGPLGGRLLLIEPRPGAIPDDASEHVYVGKAEGDLFEQLAVLADMLGEVVGENRESLKQTIADVRKIVARVEQGEGLLGRLIGDPRMAEDGKTLVADAKAFVSELSNGQGLLASLVKDGALKDRVVQIVQDVGDAVSPDARESGTIAALLHDKGMRDDVRGFVESARKVADDVATGDGLVPKLLHDPEFARKAEDMINHASSAMADISAITAKVREGDGLLGKFINDESSWNELVRILVIARESLEDLREQAPINTFANVLFSAF